MCNNELGKCDKCGKLIPLERGDNFDQLHHYTGNPADEDKWICIDCVKQLGN